MSSAIRSNIIRESDPELRIACDAALKAHREKFSEYAQIGKVCQYKVKTSKGINWVEVVSRPKSYVARIIM